MYLKKEGSPHRMESAGGVKKVISGDDGWQD